MFDICIVGAGMMGSAAARHASNKPLKVCLIGPEEPKKEEWKNSKIFSSHYDEGRQSFTLDENASCNILTTVSMQRYRELEQLSGIQVYESRNVICVGPKHNAFLQKLTQRAADRGLRFADISDTYMNERYPFLKFNHNEKVFLFEEEAGFISARNMVAAQKKVAVDLGCTVINDVVKEIKPLTLDYHEVVTEKGLVIKAKKVLICTGAFTNFQSFVPKVNGMIPSIRVEKETVSLLKISSEESYRLRTMPSVIYFNENENIPGIIGSYILPPIKYPDGCFYLKIGHMNDRGDEIITLEEVKDWYLSNGNLDLVNSLSHVLCDMIPELELLETKGATCVTCHSPSNCPYIENITSTVSIAIVGNGKGAMFSDEVGHIAAHLCISGKWISEAPQSDFKTVWKQ